MLDSFISFAYAHDMFTKDDQEWLKNIFVPAVAEEVVKRLEKQFGSYHEKLDAFLGDIRDKREAQELHANDHGRMEKRLSAVEKHLHIQPIDD